MGRKAKAEAEPIVQEKPAYISRYTSEELAKAAREAFGCDPVLAKAAFRLDGRTEYSLDEAKKVIKEFNTKEVKK